MKKADAKIKKEGVGKKMVEDLVDMRISVEEVENVDELVREGYYGSRSDAIRDMIRRGAAHLRSRYWVLKPEASERK